MWQFIVISVARETAFSAACRGEHYNPGSPLHDKEEGEYRFCKVLRIGRDRNSTTCGSMADRHGLGRVFKDVWDLEAEDNGVQVHSEMISTVRQDLFPVLP